MSRRPLGDENTPESSHLDQWRDRLQDLVDGTLDAREAEIVAVHTQRCNECGKEHSRLSRMHETLMAALSSPPALGADFSARVFGSIDAAEDLRRAAAKLKAEQEFQSRIRAFRIDWRDFFQLHLGSVVAGIAVIAALAAGLGSLWSKISASLIGAFPALAPLGDSTTLAVASLVVAISLASAAILILRTRGR